MLKTFLNAWRLPDLRKKFIFTLLMLTIFQLGIVIPVPGIAPNAIAELLGLTGEATGDNLFGLMNIISGGALQSASIFAMGITPYINSSIIMQLLTVAIPALERMQKEGEEGRKIIAKWTRYATVLLGFIQASGIYVGLVVSKALTGSFLGFLTTVISFTAGTAFLMWIGEQITEKGIGNGISLIIFTGIVSRVPEMGIQVWKAIELGNLNWITASLLLVFGLLAIAFVVAINSAERKIPIQYAKRVVGRKMYGGQSTHIPLKVAMAGVIPIIFASSILAFPSTIIRMFNSQPEGFIKKFLEFISPSGWFYAIFYFILIIFFTFFYTAMTYNPIEMANNIKNNGGFVPGIRPGKPTSDFIAKVINRVTMIGSIVIAFIAVLPIFMSKGNAVLAFGGTSLLILVGVAIETYRQIESQMLMRHYKGFLE